MLRLSELESVILQLNKHECRDCSIANQATLPAWVKVDKITYWLAYRRVHVEILFVGKEHLLHLINGQTSQKSSASFQPLSIPASLRICAGMRRKADNSRSIFAMRQTDLSLIPSVLAIWRELLLVPGSSSWFWPSTARLTSHSRSRLGNAATDRL